MEGGADVRSWRDIWGMGLKVVARVQPANVSDHAVRHSGVKTPEDA